MKKKQILEKCLDKSKEHLIEDALLKNVSGGTNTCGEDAGNGCWHDQCYDGSCSSPDNEPSDPTPIYISRK